MSTQKTTRAKYIAALVFIIAISLAAYLLFSPRDELASVAAVKKNGAVILTVPLSEDTVITAKKDGVVNGNDLGDALEYNIIEVKDGKISVIYASCPDKICVNHAPAGTVGEAIACLPNRLVIELRR